MSNEDWNELDESYRSALSGALETAHPAVEQAGGDEPIIVHCQAGMSRSAAVAKFLADKRGYTLNLSKPCLGTTQFYNRHVYGTLNLNDAESMSAYYAELELADRLRGHPKES